MADKEPISIPITYVGFDEMPITFANSFVVQHDVDEFVLTVAQLARPPIIAGTDEEIREQVSAIPFIPIKVLARYGLTRHRLVELIRVLQQNLEKYDANHGTNPPEGDDQS